MRAEPLLAIVVITRNEAKHIRACLDAVLQVVAHFAGSPVVLVDSDSSDETVAIAARYPLTVYRYRGPVLTAAAGRRIGFEKVSARYVLFLDGDCRVDAAWVKQAVGILEASPEVAVISGRRRELHESGARSASSSDDYYIGGNALFRADALRAVGNFNPFLPALEELELQGRMHAAGYRLVLTPEVMFTHHTYRQESMSSLLHLIRRGRTTAIGHLLRLSVRQGRLAAYLRQFNRYLLMLLYMIALAPVALVGRLAGVAAWGGVGTLAFVYLVVRRRSIKSAAYLIALWVTGALGILRSFGQTLPAPELFAPQIEKVV